ncbi:MAG: hypothetical protein JST51_05300 [Armatimonadetes bacterium]|nr:hypothetical protein [Armatimonadota bacterium]
MKVEDREWDQVKNPFRPAALDPASYPFFEWALHDGYVFGVEMQGDRLEFSIQDSNLELFCNQYFEEIEEEHETVLSPVRLVFEGVEYANAVRADAEGWFKWDDWSKWQPIEDLRCTDTFLRGWFKEQDGRLQWIGHFHKWPRRSGKLNWSLFVLIDCERASAKPESERALRKKLGDQCYHAWKYVESLPRDEAWLRLGHLRRYLDAKGIPRRHIPHQSER